MSLGLCNISLGYFSNTFKTKVWSDCYFIKIKEIGIVWTLQTDLDKVISLVFIYMLSRSKVNKGLKVKGILYLKLLDILKIYYAVLRDFPNQSTANSKTKEEILNSEFFIVNWKVLHTKLVCITSAMC